MTAPNPIRLFAAIACPSCGQEFTGRWLLVRIAAVYDRDLRELFDPDLAGVQ